MNGTRAIAGAEIGVLFRSPSTYVLWAVFLVASGYGFVASPATHLETSMRGVLSWALFALMFLAPALATRLLTREVEEGTIELTLTAPVSDLALVAGKFVAGLAVLGAWLASTAVLAGQLFLFGEPELGPLLTAYLAIALIAVLFLGVALFGAALATTQPLGFVLGAGLILAVWFSGALLELVPMLPADIRAAMSLANQFEELSSGFLDLRAIVLPLSITVTALFLAVRAIESRRWT